MLGTRKKRYNIHITERIVGLQRGARKTEIGRSRGFTLIEMIVSVSIFTVVVFISVGALLAISDANRKANSLRIVMDNLNFAMESMSRSLRTGKEYNCEGLGNCSDGGDYIELKNQYGESVKYEYDSDTKSVVVTRGEGDPATITSYEVEIDSLKFYVTGVGADNKQPRVTIVLNGTAGVMEKTRTRFNMQTTVSQRSVES